jgi:hypothetical protein
MAENEAVKAQQEAQQAQAKRDQEIAKTREQAKQDTSAISPGEFAGDPANIDGVRPAAGTPPQVVEAAPGVELDTDLDRAAEQRAQAKIAAPEKTPEQDLLKAAQAKAPNLTSEFVTQYGLVTEDLEAIARGEVSPPPNPGAIHSKDLYLTPGGWQVTPVSVPTEDVGKNAISR